MNWDILAQYFIFWYFSQHLSLSLSLSLSLYIYIYICQNWVLPLSTKLSSEILPTWNYLGICSCFETWFLENQVSMKNSIWWKSSNVRWLFMLKHTYIILKLDFCYAEAYRYHFMIGRQQWWDGYLCIFFRIF